VPVGRWMLCSSPSAGRPIASRRTGNAVSVGTRPTNSPYGLQVPRTPLPSQLSEPRVSRARRCHGSRGGGAGTDSARWLGGRRLPRPAVA
jgi:hypothetical protein